MLVRLKVFQLAGIAALAVPINTFLAEVFAFNQPLSVTQILLSSRWGWNTCSVASDMRLCLLLRFIIYYVSFSVWMTFRPKLLVRPICLASRWCSSFLFLHNCTSLILFADVQGSVSGVQLLMAGGLLLGCGVASTTMWYGSRRYVFCLLPLTLTTQLYPPEHNRKH